MNELYKIISQSDFSAVGIAPYAILHDERQRFARWIAQGMHNDLGYLERSVDLRHDPRNVYPDTQSVIVTLTAINRVKPHFPTLAAFAHNFRDYHVEIKNRLHVLLKQLQQEDPEIAGRAIVDSAPAFEKAWAARAGLGWIGRNSLLINPKFGSFVHIGILLVNKKIVSDPQRIADGCPEGCTLCAEACPNGAINGDRTIDARRCISCLTLEKCDRHYPAHGHILGCDICMEVCPHNSANVAIEPAIEETWANMSAEEFDRKYRNSSVGRVGLAKIQTLLDEWAK